MPAQFNSTTTSVSSYLETGDINNDGFNDVIVGSQSDASTDNVSLLINNHGQLQSGVDALTSINGGRRDASDRVTP